jgi:hypothetical protein
MYRYYLISIVLIFSGCKIQNIKNEKFSDISIQTAIIKAGSNSDEIKTVLEEVPKKFFNSAVYLISYMPESDLKTLTSKYILNNISTSYKAKEKFKWTKSLPDSIFFNYVLPYYCLDEDRDEYRDEFFNILFPLIKNAKTEYEVIDTINKNISKILGVEYNINRSKVNISPIQAIKEKMATCTGLSILLVDAFRSIGIPARIVGTPMWTNMRGNHNWVEVWIDGKWYFTEYYYDALNKSWFLTDAGKADIQKPEHCIYATSYKPAETYFPMVWDSLSQNIHAYNVTKFYIDLYEKQISEEQLKDDELWVELVMYKNRSSETPENRISKRITVKTDTSEIDFGYTPLPQDDANRFLKFKLKENGVYLFEYQNSSGYLSKHEKHMSKSQTEIIKLYENE